MNRITVRASGSYDVLIGRNLLEEIGTHIAGIRKDCKIAVISDSNVWPLYGGVVLKSLTNAGFTAIHYEFPAGEASKNAQTYLQILNFLAENKITRSDLIVALGGGVVGDISGFAAATFLRGISYIQVPTSLLAMVDSSVGGKTAIDLPIGKNLVGAFKQPRLVLCDTSVLATLPVRYFLDGCAEIIKYGMLYDRDLLDHLRKNGPEFDTEMVITRCIQHKRNVVAEDEFDTGARQKLNFGHTIGHCIESKSNYIFTHGQCVAAGMAIITKASVAKGICQKYLYDYLLDLLNQFSLPTCTDYSAEELYSIALSDKKRAGGTVNLIIPTELGQCSVLPTPVEELKSFIQAGL